MSQTIEASRQGPLEIIEKVDILSTDLVPSQFADGVLQRLVDLDTTLREASEPLPVVSVGLHFWSEITRLPEPWVGYGRTIPGVGLQPVMEKRGPTEEAHGLAVPLLEARRGSATFHTLPYEGSIYEDGSWWQQWLKTGYTNHVPGSEPDIHMIDEDADTIGADLISTWLSNEAPYTFSPSIFGDAHQDEQRIQTHEWGGYQVDSTFIAIGHEVVQATLRELLALEPQQAEIMRPLYDMLGTIAQIIEVEV